MVQQILDALITNGNDRFRANFADEALLERLRICATDSMTDGEVRDKLKMLFMQWHVAFKDQPAMNSISNLYKQFPQRKRPRPAPPPDSVSPPTSPQPAHAQMNAGSSRRGSHSLPFGNSTTITGGDSKKKDKEKYKTHQRNTSGSGKPFNLQKELPTLMDCLAKASIASTNLKNALKHLNRELQRPSENQECVKKLQEATALRKQILRFIQHVESEQWLGSLIHANEELVDAIVLYKTMDKPIEEDSDSEDIEADTQANRLSRDMAGLHFDDRTAAGPPPRPPPSASKGKLVQSLQQRQQEEEEDDEVEEDEDENNPFSDTYRVEN